MKKNLVGAIIVLLGLCMLSTQIVVAQDICEGNYDGDSDVDGTDASVFKSDFGRSSFSNPCPPCAGIIPGMLMMWSGSFATIPSGWLPCDGSEINREVYPDLFASIAIIYGEGDGLTTFNLPNFVNSSPMGASEDIEGKPMTDVSGILTQEGGEASHTLTVDEMPSHQHEQVWFRDEGQRIDTSAAGGVIGSYIDVQGTGNTGGDQPHNNLHPYFAITYIIFAGRPVLCMEGETRQCGTDVGECEYGTATCDVDGMWGECIGGVTPVSEVCDDGLDNDCDELVDTDDPPCCIEAFGSCETGLSCCSGCCVGWCCPVNMVYAGTCYDYVHMERECY